MAGFVNCYKINERIYGEYIKNVLFGRLRRIAVITAALGLLLFLIELKDNAFPVLSALIPFLSVFILLMTELIGKLSIKKMRKYHAGEPPETRIAFGDDIRTSEGAKANVIEYAKITHIHNLKHTYVLQCGKEVCIIAVKGKFTVGDEAEFCGFLKTKCPEAKLDGTKNYK